MWAAEPSLEKRTLVLADYCDRLDSALLKVAEQGSSFELEAVSNSEAEPECGPHQQPSLLSYVNGAPALICLLRASEDV